MKSRPMFPICSGGSAKRPKMKAGFVLDSDESEAEETDDDGDYNGSIPAVLRPPSERPTLAGRKTEFNAASLPTKQFNKSRLNTLLGRNKNASSHPKENQQSAPMITTTARPPASLSKQKQTPQPTNDKRESINSSIIDRKRPSSNLANSIQVKSRPVQKPVATTDTPANAQMPEVMSGKSTSITQGSAHRTAAVTSQQTDAPKVFQSTFSDAMKNVRSQSYPSSQIGEAGDNQNMKVSKSPKLPSLGIHKLEKAYQSITGKPMDYTGTESELPRSPMARQSAQPTARQPPRVQSSDGTTVERSQLPIGHPTNPQYQKQNPGLATRVPRPNQTAGGLVSIPKIAPGTHLTQKRKAQDITGGPSDNATPLKKPSITSESSSAPAHLVSMQQETPTAGMNSKPSLQSPATFKSIRTTGLPAITSHTGLQSASTPNAFNKPSSTVSSHPTGQRLKSVASPSTPGLTTQNGATQPKVTGMLNANTANQSSSQYMSTSRPSPEVIRRPTTATNTVRCSTVDTPARVGRPSVSRNATLSLQNARKNPEALARPGLNGVTLAPPSTPHKVADIPMTAAADHHTDVLILPILEISDAAEPYFEYSVFQNLWSNEQNETDTMPTEIISRPYTNIDEANAQAEKLFHNVREQYTQHFQFQFSEWSSKRSHDCLVLVGTFSPMDYPIKKSHIKIWVQRNSVSRFASQTPQAWTQTPLISKTAFTLRLFRLVAMSDDTDSEPPVRVYHKLPCSEVYTTLDTANRAARKLQIELSHVKDPKDDINAKWQEQDLKDLNAKVQSLDLSMRGSAGCWKSEFNACGKGGDRFEVVVEKVSICGPRN